MKQNTAIEARSNRVMYIITFMLLLISTASFAQTAPIDTAIDGSGNGNYGILHNFALNGSSSNWVAGNATGSCGAFVPPTATVSAGGATTFCQGGSVTLTAGAVTGAGYQWANGGVNISGATAQTFVATVTGSYVVVVTVSGNCTAISAATAVTVNALPTVSAGSSVAICTGSSTTLSATSGLSSYSWSPTTALGCPTCSSTSADPTGNTTYTVTATNSFGCSNKATVTITVNSLPTAYLVTGGGAYCFGGGGTLIGVQNTETGVNYQLFRGSTPVGGTVAGSGPSISFGPQTVAGTYTSVGTIATTTCSITMTDSAVVSINPIPNVVPVSNQADCNGNTQAAISFSGSVSGTSFSWTNNNSSIGLGSGGTGTVCGTASENGTVVLTAPIGSVFTSVDFASFGTPNGTCGSFTIGSCNAPNSMTVVQSLVLGNNTASIPANNATFTDPCFGTGKRLYIQASYSSTGSISAFTATNTGASPISGSIIVTPTASGCTGTPDTFTITVNPSPTSYSVTGGGSYCSGGTGVAVGLSSSQTGINYQLKISGTPVGSPVAGTGSAISFGLITTAGIYTVSATNATTSCTADMSGSATVTVNSLPVLITGISNVCAGSTTVLTDATAGGTWSSSNSNATVVSTGTVTGVIAGTSIITYKLGTGCAVSNIVTVNPLPTVSAGSSATACSGAPTTLSATSGLSSYSWSPSTDLSCTTCQSPVATPTVTTTYTVTGTNGNGCSNKASVTINVNPLPVVTESAGGPTTFCAGGSVLLTAAGNAAGNALEFNGSNQEVTPTATASVAGLGATAFTLEGWVYYSNSGVNTIIAKDGDYKLYVNGNTLHAESWYAGVGNPAWKKFDGSVTLTQNTWTHVAATWDGTTCKLYINGVADASVSTSAGSQPYVDNLTIGYSSIFGQYFQGKLDEIRIWNAARTATQIGANWNVGVAPTTSGLGAYYKFDEGTGTTTADATGNGNTGTLVNAPTWEVPSTAPIKFNSYVWSPGTATTSTVSETTTGSYSVTVTNSNGCVNTSTGTAVTVNPLPTVSAGSPVSICRGNSTTLSATSGLTSYSWSPSTGLSCTTCQSPVASPTVTTSYTVTVTNSSSCTNTAIVTVTVNPLPTISAGSPVTICNGGSTTLTASGGATYSWSPATALSATTGVSVSADPTTNTTYTVLGVSAAGCSSTGSVTVTVHNAPVITCSGGATQNADAGICNAVVTYSASTATGTSPTITYSKNSGTTFAVGTTTVTATATNSCGVDSCHFTVTVNDNQNPTITAPSGITVNADAGSCSATGYTLGTATTADNCGVASTTNNDSGSYAVGVHTITWIVTDIHGNSTTATQSITVVDNQPPAISVPSGITVNADAGSCSATGYTLGTATATDNCGVASVTSNDSGSYAVGTHTITWTATDVNSNVTTGTQTITVVDNQPPTITVPSGITVNADAGSCSATGYTLGTATATDNCGVASVTSNDSGSYAVGTHTITWTATDVNGNVTTGTQTITVNDNQPPAISVPSGITVNADAGSCSATGYTLGTATATDNCGVASVTSNDSGSYAVGSHTITWTATDVNGNVTTGTQRITVNDNQPPAISVPSGIMVNANAGSCSATGYTLGTATATDNCGVASVTSNDSGSYAVGTHTITWTATDVNGNVTTGTQTITVNDNQPPAISVPSGITVNADAGSCSATGYTLGTATATDNCGVASVTSNDSGSYSVGTHTITWTATDVNGNVTTGTQTITVNDNQPPAISVPSGITVNADAGSCSATGYTLGTATATDNCGVASVTSNDSGSYAVGSHTITWTATDVNGNVTTGTQTITVNDNQPPAISVPSGITVNADAGSCSATGYTLGTATATDNCGVASVTSNDSGSYSVGTHTITWTATDVNGNVTTGTQTITVNDNQPPAISVPSGITVNADAGSCSATGYILGTATATDNCGVASVTSNDSGSYSVGTHTITWMATDVNGNVTTGTQTITVNDNQPPAISVPSGITVNADAGSCSATGYILGTATATDNCGVASVTSNDSGSYSVGTHTITWMATDIHGNVTTGTQTITVNDNQAPTITAPANITVNGYCRSITDTLGTPVTADNCGVAGYTNDAPSTFPVGTTTVTWTVTDIHGNTATATQLVTVNPATLVLTPTISNISCNGASDGSISTSVSGGTAAYTYLWSTGATTTGISGKPAGTYTVTVTDAHSCSTTAAYTITQPDVLSLASAVAVNVTCHGLNNGTITTNVTGGTTAYGYTWSTGSHSANLTALAPGTYSVTVTDAHGCTVKGSYTVTQPSAVLALSATKTNSLCFDSAGKVVTTVTGGTTPYSYAWSNGATSANLVAVSGSYSVTVTDKNGCTVTGGTYTITQPTQLVFSTYISNVSCYGGSDGYIDADISGGTCPYSYSWSTTYGSGYAFYDDVYYATAAAYSVTVTDGNGCKITQVDTITQPPALSISAVTTGVSCHGGSDGAINTTVLGGTRPYSYSWSGWYGSHDSDRTGLSAGTYYVTVTDAHGCTISASYTVSQPEALSLSAVVTNVSCHGGSNGSINTTAGGGTGPYTYVWSNGSTMADPGSLAAGTYNVTVTDAHGCTITGSYTVTQPSAISITATTTNVSCYGGATGSINTTVSGGTSGYSYIWSNGSTLADPAGLAMGTCSVTVTDAHGCTNTASYTITQPAALSITASVTNVSCHGGATGSINTTVTGGTSSYSYSWSGGGCSSHVADPAGLSAGTYTVTVTDAHGCTITASYTITQPSAITVAATTTNVSCHGGSDGAINTTVSGGVAPYTYNWGGSVHDSDRTSLTAGTYNVTVTDANGCTATASYTITQPSSISISATTTNPTCREGSSGSINTTVSGGTSGYTYVWSNGSTAADQTGLGAGTYTVTVTDAHGCTATASYTLTAPSSLVFSTDIDEVSCYGGSDGHIDADISGGSYPYSYTWTTGGVGYSSYDDFYGPVGTYTVTVTDAKGCSLTASYTITQPPVLSITATTTNENCHGASAGSINTTVLGGTPSYSYSWGGGCGSHVADPAGLSAGTYPVTVTDANGCTITGSYTITQPTAITISATTTNASCHGSSNGAINTSVSGGAAPYTYNWGGGIHDSDRTGLAAGTYNVTVTDANGCTATASYIITQPSTLSISAVVTNVGCKGGTTGSINTTVSGGTSGYSYVWSNGSTVADPAGLAAGTYTVTVTDAHGCTATASYTVTEPLALTASAVVTGATCHHSDGSINLTVSCGTPSYGYGWSHGAHTAYVTGLAPGAYTCTITDANSCTKICSYTISSCAEGRSSDTGSTTGVAAAPADDDMIKVYPNPTEGVFSVEIPLAHKEAVIMITDLTGRIIATRNVTGNTGEPVQFSLNDVAKGVYLVKVNAGQTSYVGKLVIR